MIEHSNGVIEYLDSGKRAIFNGLVYVRDDRTGYYLNSTYRRRLHRDVYEYYYGKIPKGYHVHHINMDKRDNSPQNLIAVSRRIHNRLHEDLMPEEKRKARIDNMLQNVIPAAKEWHRSPEGREWHKAHYEQTKDALHKRKIMHCEYCGKLFEGSDSPHSKFCSNACKSAYRRAMGYDNVERICAWCAKPFMSNKYKNVRTCCRSCANKLRHSISKNQIDSESSA